MSISNIGSLTNNNASYLFSKPVLAITVALTILAALGAYLFYKGYFSFTARANPPAHTPSVPTPTSPAISTAPTSPKTSIKYQLNKADVEFLLTDSNNQHIVLPKEIADRFISLNGDFEYDIDSKCWIVHCNSNDHMYQIGEDGEIIREYDRREYVKAENASPRYAVKDLEQAMLAFQEKYHYVNPNVWIPKVVINRAEANGADFIEITDCEWRIIFNDRNAIGYVEQNNGEFLVRQFSERNPTSAARRSLFYSLKDSTIRHLF